MSRLALAALSMSMSMSLSMSLSLAASFAHAQTTGFVKVEGDRFVLDGKPFAFVGANLATLQGIEARSRYREVIGAAVRDGLTVGRVWAFGEGPVDAPPWHREHELFRAGPDGFLEAAYVQLDHVLAEAHARGLRLIVTLANNWSDYGGVPMYLRWAGLPEGEGPDDPAREAFYRDPRVRDFFRAGVARLLDRTNTVSGVPYVDEPAIFSWELMNESRVVSPEGAEARRAFIAEMARFIKQRDPHHLVSAGVAGYASRDERDEWIRVHRMPEIDYCDSHLYPEGSDPISVADTPREAKRAERRLFDFLDDRAQLARFVVGKPLVLGEFGFRTDRRGAAADRAGAKARRARPFLGVDRATWFERLLGRAFTDGAAGALAWIYQPWNGVVRDFGIYVDGGATDDVRAVLRRHAEVAAAADAPASANPRLGPASGDAFLYDPLVTVPGRAAPLDGWRDANGARSLRIAPGAFAEARFEHVGSSRTGPLAHVYGGGWGFFRYRFEAPRDLVPRKVRVEARLSSEWPGRFAPAVGGGGQVRLVLDGVALETREVARDDGLGAPETFVVEDRGLLRRLSRPGPHTLAFEVPDAPGSHGLCVYGRGIRVVYQPRAPRPAVAATPVATSPR